MPRVIKQSKKENEQKPCIQVNPSSGLSNSLEEIQAMANMMVNEIEQLQTSRTAIALSKERGYHSFLSILRNYLWTYVLYRSITKYFKGTLYLDRKVKRKNISPKGQDEQCII